MSHLNHPFFLNLEFAFRENESIFIGTKFADEGTLDEFIKKNREESKKEEAIIFEKKNLR